MCAPGALLRLLSQHALQTRACHRGSLGRDTAALSSSFRLLSLPQEHQYVPVKLGSRVAVLVNRYYTISSRMLALALPSPHCAVVVVLVVLCLRCLLYTLHCPDHRVCLSIPSLCCCIICIIQLYITACTIHPASPFALLCPQPGRHSGNGGDDCSGQGSGPATGGG